MSPHLQLQKNKQTSKEVRGKARRIWAEFYRTLIGLKENPSTQSQVRSVCQDFALRGSRR